MGWGGVGGGSAALGGVGGGSAASGALQRGRVVVEVAFGVTAKTRAATRHLGVAFGLARAALLAGGAAAHAPGRGWRHGKRATGGSQWQRVLGGVLGVLLAIIAASGSMSTVTAGGGGPETFGRRAGHWCVPGHRGRTDRIGCVVD